MLLIFSLPAIKSVAQDYVINNKNDTIPCKIKKGFFNSRLRYFTKGDSTKHDIDATLLNEYFKASDSTKWVSEFLPGQNQPEFVQLIIRGEISIYQVIETYSTGRGNYSSQKFLYAKKSNGELRQIYSKWLGLNIGAVFHSTQDERKSFFDLLADNTTLSAKLNEGDYSPKKIKKIVETYNQQYLAKGNHTN